MVLIIMGCKMFLRPDELLTIELKDFVPKLCVSKGDRIVGLLCKVMGKCDGKEVNLWIWADDENPELCPVRHLLVYMYLAEIKGGYLFPKKAELLGKEEPSEIEEGDKTIYKPRDGVYKHALPYSSFLPTFKKIVEQCLPKKALRIGLHMLRKTANLLGV